MSFLTDRAKISLFEWYRLSGKVPERREAMNAKKIAEANFSDTGYSYTLSLISGKYKPLFSIA